MIGAHRGPLRFRSALNAGEYALSGQGRLVLIVGSAKRGKTRLVEEVVTLAREQGVHHVWAASQETTAMPSMWTWVQCLRGFGARGKELASLLLEEDQDRTGQLLQFDAIGELLREWPDPILLLFDDIHSADAGSRQLLAFTARWLRGSHVTIVATSNPATDQLGTELEQLADVVQLANADALSVILELGDGRVIEGRPEAARQLFDEALELALQSGLGAVTQAEIVLRMPSSADYLEVDVRLVRLLEQALDTGLEEDGSLRSRLLARLAMELLGDRSACDRRRSFADQALTEAEATGDPGCLAFALHARQYALWEAYHAPQRLFEADRIIELARQADDVDTELQGRFWRFVARVELGELVEAEDELAAYARLADLLDRDDLRLFVISRQALFAIIRGRFDEGLRLTGEASLVGQRAGIRDTERVLNGLHAMIYMERDPSAVGPVVDWLLDLARRLPGQLFETSAARGLMVMGHEEEAAAELRRVLPAALIGTGPRRLASLAHLASVAARINDVDLCARLYEALLPDAGYVVTHGGAAAAFGLVTHYLGITAAGAGRLDCALNHLEEACGRYEEMGALPWLANGRADLASVLRSRRGEGDESQAMALETQALKAARVLEMTVLVDRLERAAKASERTWILERDGADWILRAGKEHTRFRDSRGMHFLVALLRHPGADVHSLDLVAGGAGLVVGHGASLLDADAKAAYRRRLAALESELEAADRAGDRSRAEEAINEKEALMAELRRATGLGGRDRRAAAESERARVNVTRSLKLALEHIEQAAPLAGAHLRASIRTGASCRYQPTDGGPASWKV